MPGMPHSERFWTVTDAWTREAVEHPRTGAWMRARAKFFRVDLGQRRGTTPGTWRPRGPRVPKVHNGGKLITVPPEISLLVGELMEVVAPALQSTFDKHLAGLATEVWAVWPTTSNLSRASVALEYRVEAAGTRFIGSIRVDAPYAQYIKGGPGTKLLFQPAEWVTHRMSVEAADELAQAVR